MSNVPAATTVDQAARCDTPKRRATSAWAQACTAAVREAPVRRLHGGWRRIDQDQHLAQLIVHRSGRAYTARHVRNGLAEAEAMGLIEVRRHRVQRPDGTWRTEGRNAYRVVSARRIRAGQTDRKPGAPHAVLAAGQGADLAREHPPGPTSPALVECSGCGAPFPRASAPPDRTCRACR